MVDKRNLWFGAELIPALNEIKASFTSFTLYLFHGTHLYVKQTTSTYSVTNINNLQSILVNFLKLAVHIREHFLVRLNGFIFTYFCMFTTFHLDPTYTIKNFNLTKRRKK